ncbi:MAG: hypothetical protein JSR45_10640 [Proteobacteria bacterium]|nr:hypothetical protein [Pseudomonadota bacterium]
MLNRSKVVVVASALMCGLAGCEQHPASRAQRAPEYMHGALSGDIMEQAALADCYATGANCMAIRKDLALSCAWRGVRLASHSPVLAVSDNEAYAAACKGLEGAARQRAEIAEQDLSFRVWGRLAPGDGALPSRPLLYPSAETVRLRLNVELVRAKDRRQLPAFGAPRPLGNDALAWASCADKLCLEATGPHYGGGLAGFKVILSSTAGPARKALAARLAGAGLDAPGLALHLTRIDGRSQTGPVCWSVTQSADATAIEALPTPCPAR